MSSMISQGIQKKASDIHVFSKKDGAVIKYRVNGELKNEFQLNFSQYNQLKQSIKYNSDCDISIYNKPQDGRLTYDGVDIRVSCMPTAFGEDIVLRIFNQEVVEYDLNQLGFSDEALNLVNDLLNQKQGLILVTGPTGSGKTTTLYSMLEKLKQNKDYNIISLEDPIESIIPGVRQSQINSDIGYTFQEGLKNSLRQDPDIIMIGEIRDEKTAKIALEAAYTGHLIIATLHTSNCESTLYRLAGFNCDTFLLGYCLKGIISQKLIESESRPSNRMLLAEVLKINKRVYAKDMAQLVNKSFKDNIFYSFKEDEAIKSSFKKNR